MEAHDNNANALLDNLFQFSVVLFVLAYEKLLVE